MFTVVEVTVRINRSLMEKELVAGSKELVNRTSLAVAERAKFYAPLGSGHLRSRILPRAAEQVSGSRVEGRVVADTYYAVWQHEGTGIYGPRGRRIKPVRAPALRFYWKKVGSVVYFKSVRGTKPTKFLVKAVEDICTESFWDVQYFTSM